MTIKATTTNPATRFCTMAATPAQLMTKATSAIVPRRDRGINAGARFLSADRGWGLSGQREVALPRRAQPSN
ncbi:MULTISPECIES: hypothetical protein [unclassified Bradyrhizobium]|uniref:hypothetical protein n=1 Tax=unclassified Bradyrhizobium TaxID=2631580 RepID=UPI0013EEC83B|nr:MULTISPECIES: hypothetical protein [unclassified Bradyrhizobium]MDI4238327.1 hypothetical protein [Bradyrhizobium sp. Arg237L]